LPSFLAAAGADLRQPPGGGRTDRALATALARDAVEWWLPTSSKGQARSDRGLRCGNGGDRSRSGRRFGVGRDRALGEYRQGDKMKRGEVYWADPVPRSGSEQTGRRPVMVVSHDGFNQSPGWRSVIVVPISTSSSQGQRGPTAIELPGGTAGLPKTSFVVCHQATTMDRGKPTKRLGALPSETPREVEEGLKAALDLECPGWPLGAHGSPDRRGIHAKSGKPTQPSGMR
jgi:mRNA-degrading endonuclease toxin of MazEF toxin-antitoxin module